MLQDADLKAKGQSAHEAVNSLLRNYNSLLEDYRSLKSDYEEEKEGREKYKRIARGASPALGVKGSTTGSSLSTTRPFALVLIDGDHYFFNDRLLKQEAEGGAEAAQALHDEIEKCLLARGLVNCDVVVRVYADFVSLSKRLSLAKRIKPHKRSIAEFASGFTGQHPKFDFVDVGEEAGNTYKKISGMNSNPAR